ncbi:hypothetical protein [robinz microvirus RP_86]|nr:hypothetical protein [robinz microvirus RP_86]
MSKKRRSISVTLSNFRPGAPKREAFWDRRYTLEVIRRSQPDPFIKLIPPEFVPQTFTLTPAQRRPSSVPRVNLVAAKRPPRFSDGRYAVDKRTGEILDHRCADKETRRHIIIVSGHGGRNGQTNYSQRKPC